MHFQSGNTSYQLTQALTAGWGTISSSNRHNHSSSNISLHSTEGRLGP